MDSMLGLVVGVPGSIPTLDKSYKTLTSFIDPGTQHRRPTIALPSLWTAWMQAEILLIMHPGRRRSKTL